MSYRVCKRLMDMVGASLLLVVTAPLTAIAATLVWVRLGRPILFRQLRTGRDGRVFTLIKFRTMTDPVPGQPCDDAARLTGVGSLLRAMSLDELPTLVNVLRGDMSLVGPRPLLPAYLGRYSPQQARRHEVRPGITGLAQVSGRNALGWSEKFALDVEYVDTVCLRVDLQILVRTIPAVLLRRGISAEGSATMAEFLGNAGER